MRKNLTQHINPSNLTDFLPGDVVVLKSENAIEQLLTVSTVEQDSILLESESKFASSHLIRHATVAEIKAKRRLDPPVALFVSEAP
jgi:hypothetical protein